MTDFRKRVSFETPPAAGLKLIIDGQSYELTGHQPYTTKAGEETILLVWSTDCPDCGATFETTSAKTSLPANRRCDEHKRPGIKVDPDRPRRIADAAGSS